MNSTPDRLLRKRPLPSQAYANPKPRHYHDIDGARSVLIFLTVALHAGTVYAPARVGWRIALYRCICSTIAIHELLVRRLALVRLLFNGKTEIDQLRLAPGLIKSFS